MMDPSLELERSWWGDCCNTFHEEQKQLVYASRMELLADWNCGHPPQFDLQGRSVVDVGGGPSSLLLKTVNAGERLVIDPCDFPPWVYARYREAGIYVMRQPGERWTSAGFDEGWIYNVLQHVENPELVIETMKTNCRLIRIFEWIDIPAYPGHPHELKSELLERWLGPGGRETYVNDFGAVGTAFHGVFEQG